MAAFDVTESGGRLVIVPSRSGAVRDIAPLVALFLVPLVPLTLLLTALDDTRGLASLLLLGVAAVIVLLLVSGFLLAMQVYRRHRLDGRLVLDRGADEVRLGASRLGALSHVAAVEVRAAEGARRDLVLVGPGSADLARVGGGGAAEVADVARRIATFSGTPLVEP